MEGLTRGCGPGRRRITVAVSPPRSKGSRLEAVAWSFAVRADHDHGSDSVDRSFEDRGSALSSAVVCDGALHPVAAPSVRTFSIAVLDAWSAIDAWAVGGTIGTGDPEPVSMHWDGTRWTRFPFANPEIFGVKDVAATDGSA